MAGCLRYINAQIDYMCGLQLLCVVRAPHMLIRYPVYLWQGDTQYKITLRGKLHLEDPSEHQGPVGIEQL